MNHSTTTTTTTTNHHVLVHQAALLNREGIAALACGYAEKAHACFKNVLEIMGYISQAPDLAAVVVNHNSSSNNLEGLSPVPIPNLQSDRFFVYDNALLFHPVDHQQQQQGAASTISQWDVTLMSAAAIFNMALTYNQRALMRRSHPGMLRVAGRMYDQCLQILQSLPEMMDTEGMDVISMIVWNNRSHVYYELSDFGKAQEALEEVRRVSRRIAARHHHHGGAAATMMLSSILEEDAFDEIALNVLVTTPPSTAPCA